MLLEKCSGVPSNNNNNNNNNNINQDINGAVIMLQALQSSPGECRLER